MHEAEQVERTDHSDFPFWNTLHSSLVTMCRGPSISHSIEFVEPRADCIGDRAMAY